MYELADRPPKAGSLKDSLFLTVWLKRQEIELAKWRVVAQGAANGAEVGGTFKDLIASIFPFMKDATRTSDKKLIEQMQKEVARGPITFTQINTNPFKDKVKKMAMPDETMQKLRKAAAARAGRKL
jgi:hypothetical protein